jgi:hypothetical protein
MMPIILPNNTLTAQLPQPRIVITTRRNQIRAISAERAVPDPALVAVQGGLEREGGGVALCGAGEGVAGLYVVGGGEVDAPDARGVVGGAGGEVADVGGEEDAGYVGVVGEEFADGDYGGEVAAHDHFPDVDVALGEIVSGLLYYTVNGALTALFPAQTILPSLATVTLATDTSSSGISWWLHLFSPRSQMRTLPPRSQLMSSPWFGWITTSLTGTPWV